MLFGKKPSKGKYVKAKNLEAQKKQKAVIISYYAKKREEKIKKVIIRHNTYFLIKKLTL